MCGEGADQVACYSVRCVRSVILSNTRASWRMPSPAGSSCRGPRGLTTGTTSTSRWPPSSHCHCEASKHLQNLIDYEWEIHEGPGGHKQWRPVVGAGEEPPQAPSAANTSTQTIGMLTSDVALVSDPSFKVAYYLVTRYRRTRHAVSRLWWRSLLRTEPTLRLSLPTRGTDSPPGGVTQHKLRSRRGK